MSSFEGRPSLTSASAGVHPNSNLVIFQVRGIADERWRPLQ
jgi:hypothetical protein